MDYEKKKGKKENRKPRPIKKGKHERTWSLVVYLLSIIGVIIAYFTGKWKNKFIKYHAKQSIGLLIAYIAVTAIGAVVPFLGWFIIIPLAQIGFVILWIVGMLNSLEGKIKPLPFIGEYSEKIDL